MYIHTHISVVFLIINNPGYNLYYICFLCIIVPSTGCGAISSEGACFKQIVHGYYNWYSGSSYCISYGFDNLATISSHEENAMLSNASPFGSDCWIGLNDISSEGTYVWVDGSDSTYREWYTNQPNSATSYFDAVARRYYNGEWYTYYHYYSRSCSFCRINSKFSLIL